MSIITLIHRVASICGVNSLFRSGRIAGGILAGVVALAPRASAEQPPAPQVSIVRTGAQFKLTIGSILGLTNEVQYTENLGAAAWTTLTNLLVTQTPYVALDTNIVPAGRRFYRVRAWFPEGAPTNMAYIPAGYFTMGGVFAGETPVHSVFTSALYLDRTEVTKILWDQVYLWGLTNGYQFDNAGTVKSNGHPVYNINWYDAVKWCNARSEREGRVPAYYTDATQLNVYRTGWLTNADASFVKWKAGYRLPTEAEWEKGSRGGFSGRTYPWGNSISYVEANWNYHPTYSGTPRPYTSPVGAFAPNGYGLYDVSGNVWEWCWDYYSSTYYSTSPQLDPRGPATGTNHASRGGAWDNGSTQQRCGGRYGNFTTPGITWNLGMRAALGAAP